MTTRLSASPRRTVASIARSRITDISNFASNAGTVLGHGFAVDYFTVAMLIVSATIANDLG